MIIIISIIIVIINRTIILNMIIIVIIIIICIPGSRAAPPAGPRPAPWRSAWGGANRVSSEICFF